MELEDIIRFFEAKKAQGGCPTCGNNDWGLVPNENMRFDKYTIPPLNFSGSTVPVIVLRCKNCEFVRLHAAASIQEWTDANPNPNLKRDEASPANDSATGDEGRR